MTSLSRSDSGAPDAPTPEVVVVDDEPGILHTLLLELGLADHVTRGFSDPLDALMWVSDADPCCIVVDLKIPGVDGLDLISAFTAMRRHAVIVISAYISVPDAVEAMKLGCKTVLQKPVPAGRLVDAVAEAVQTLGPVAFDEALTFTRRERQVGELLMQGLTTKQIAQSLELSPRTVDFFRASLLRKTCSPNTAALVVALGRIGFGDVPGTD
jgi:two-component system response regulator FixJ